ncbi:MAG: sugar phosphate isomerase/epimerase [Anaerolineae bacterium]|nr:sugar phosphate isomerase/epimerase [Anaerolineae bacterium]
MSLPIAVQMYAIREDLAQDFDATMDRVAHIGYAGMELIYGIPGASQEHAERRLRELGLKVPCAHVPSPFGADEQPVIEFAQRFGVERLVTGRGLGNFDNLGLIEATCDAYNRGAETARRQGYTLSIHNHWMEYERAADGRYVYEIMLELLDPSIKFEIDAYWVQTAGIDPAAIVRQLGDRVNLLHVKDGPAAIEPPQVALGQGVMNIPAVVNAAIAAEWLVVELDHCATDMLDAVDQSFQYLVRKGLGHGKSA